MNDYFLVCTPCLQLLNNLQFYCFSVCLTAKQLQHNLGPQTYLTTCNLVSQNQCFTLVFKVVCAQYVLSMYS